MSSKEIVLTSLDGEYFEIDEAVARKMHVIAHMIEDDYADKPILLRNITGKILALVIEYCKKHVDEHDDSDDIDAIRGKVDVEAKKELDTWDAEFMKDIDMDTVFKLMNAANSFNIKGLFYLTTQTVSDYIKDMKEHARTIVDYIEDKNEHTRMFSDYHIIKSSRSRTIKHPKKKPGFVRKMLGLLKASK